MFPSGWRKVKLGGLVEITSGVAPSLLSLQDSGSFPYVKVEDMNNCDKYQIRSRSYTDDKVKSAPKGSVIFPKRGAAIMNNKVRIAATDLYLDSNMMSLFPCKTLNSEFLYYSLLSERLYRIADTSTIPQINNKHITPYKVLLPPLPEQKKIAAILSTWDDAISANEDLLANSRLRKKALMQQLLTGKKRLPGFEDKWISASIAQFCKKESIRAGMDESYPVLSCTKYHGFVDSLDYFNKQVFSDDTSNYKVIKRDWIGFPSNHVEEGSIGIQNLYQAGIVSPIYEVFSIDNSKCLPDYLYANLKSDMYRQIFASRTNASVDRRGSLRWDAFSQIDVLLPPVDEQKCIVDIITTSAKEIEALEQRINNLKLQKKALMQQLLTGKKRVKVEPVTA